MKLPRDLSGRQAIAALRRLGFVEVRQSGSHVRLQRASVGVAVPLHGSLKPKTLLSILRQAGIPIEEFQQFL